MLSYYSLIFSYLFYSLISQVSLLINASEFCLSILTINNTSNNSLDFPLCWNPVLLQFSFRSPYPSAACWCGLHCRLLVSARCFSLALGPCDCGWVQVSCQNAVLLPCLPWQCSHILKEICSCLKCLFTLLPLWTCFGTFRFCAVPRAKIRGQFPFCALWSGVLRGGHL